MVSNTMKKIGAFMTLMVMMLVSVNATAPYFFSQSPTFVDNLDSTYSVEFDIGDDDGFGVDGVVDFYVSNACGTDQLEASGSFPVQNARDFVGVLYDAPYDGDYYAIVTLRNIGTNETFQGTTNVYNVDEGVPQDCSEPQTGFFTTFLSDIGNGLGAFLSAIQEPLIYFILVLGIGGAIGGLVYAIVGRVKKGM